MINNWSVAGVFVSGINLGLILSFWLATGFTITNIFLFILAIVTLFFAWVGIVK